MRHASAFACVALLLAGCIDSPGIRGPLLAETPTPTPTPTPTMRANPADALTVAPEHRTGYDRDLFGTPWRVDIDGNGCTAQQDVLRRDLADVVVRGRCTVLSGSLVDPYTGVGVSYVRGGPAEVDIDHVVALAEAWQSGAWAWTPAQRAAFASDPTNLLATSSSVNRAKGEDDGAWETGGVALPAGPERRCRYARIVVEVKAGYGLSVDSTEQAELAEMYAGCPS